jgi:hypothetical protein
MGASLVPLASAARRTAVSVAGLLLCAVLFVTSLAFFTLAAYRALAEAVGAIQAPLAVGGTYLVFRAGRSAGPPVAPLITTRLRPRRRRS